VRQLFCRAYSSFYKDFYGNKDEISAIRSFECTYST
jgi:hypothetical protein